MNRNDANECLNKVRLSGRLDGGDGGRIKACEAILNWS